MSISRVLNNFLKMMLILALSLSVSLAEVIELQSNVFLVELQNGKSLYIPSNLIDILRKGQSNTNKLSGEQRYLKNGMSVILTKDDWTILEEASKQYEENLNAETISSQESEKRYGFSQFKIASTDETKIKVVESQSNDRSESNRNQKATNTQDAPSGQVWHRENENEPWKLISEQEYIAKRKEELRSEFADTLGQELPVQKEINVYDLDTGQEITLPDKAGFKIQATDFGPRNSVRVKVIDRDGNVLSGDYITKQSNVLNGTLRNTAYNVLSALEKVRAAGTALQQCTDGTEKPSATFIPVPRPRPDQGNPTQSNPVGFQPGCEALADGINESDAPSLKQCIASIISFIKSGSNNQRCKIVQNMFKLKEEEQNFAALIMTTRGEAPSLAGGGSADHLMVMKSLENRVNAAKRMRWRQPISVMDLSLQPMQYSMFNASASGRFSKTRFLNPKGYDKFIESYIAYNKATWEPPGVIDKITHYFSPPAMKPKNSTAWWANPSRNSNRTLREVTSSVKVNGQGVLDEEDSPDGYHRFYTGVDGASNYSTVRSSRHSLGQCNK